jgi:hypothetical protein
VYPHGLKQNTTGNTMIRNILVLILALTLASCSATIQTVTETRSPDGTVVTTTSTDTETSVYHKSVAMHSVAEKDKAVAQADAIKNISVAGLSTDAQALLVDRKLNAIASLETKPYSGQKPTNGYDIGMAVASQGASIGTSIVTGTVLWKAMDTVGKVADRPTVQNIAQNDSQINYERNDVNSSGESQSTLTKGGAPSEDLEYEGDLVGAFNFCSNDGSYTKTLGQVGTCIGQETGREARIVGGLLYIDGVPFDTVNEWEAARE